MNDNFAQFRDKLFTEAKNRGFSDCEAFFINNVTFGVHVFAGEVTELKSAGDSGVSFRGIIDGKMGYAYSENISDEVISFLVENAAQNAAIIDTPDVDTLFAGAKEYPNAKTYNQKLDVSTERKIELLVGAENAAGERDKRIKSTYANLSHKTKDVIISNTLGLNVSSKSNSAYIIISPTAKGEDGQLKSSGDLAQITDFAKFDEKKFGEKCADLTLNLLGAKPVKTGKYNIIFDKDAFSTLLEVYAAVFNAEQAQKGLSLLAGKIGEKIASDVITLRDDPLLEKGLLVANFDDEGVPTRNKTLIENGVFKTFLHSQKTAKKDGIESTGNGFRSSYKSSVSIEATNFYIQNGEKSPEQLIKELGNGLLITEVTALSGCNAISGDFSVPVTGFLVENGKASRPVDQITIAGNFFDLLKNIQSIANDLEFKLSCASPSILVKNLSISGD